MKKSFKNSVSITIVFTLLVFFVACGDNNGTYDNGDYAYVDEVFTHEQLLDDLAFLIELLEAEFGLFDAAYWAQGIDIRELYLQTVADVLEKNYIDEQTFAHIIRTNFSVLNNFALFSVISPTLRNFQLNDIDHRLMEELVAELNLNTGDFGVDAFLMFLSFPEEREFVQNDLLETVGREIAEMFIQSVEGLDFELFLEVLEAIQQTTIVETKVISQGSAAYIAFQTLLHAPDFTIEKIFDFYEEIKDFEHLIVDLRGVQTGNHRNFNDLIIAPNIADPLTKKTYLFFVDGYLMENNGLARIFVNSGLGNRRRMAVVDALNELYFSDLRHEDITRFDYVLELPQTVNPNLLGRFDYQPAFDGKIWLLIDGETNYPSEISARFASHTGFATVVGGISGGKNYGQLVRVTLPNSRLEIGFDMMYHTDSKGRLFHAGTVPHYFNRQGMDALQTVLAMIEEGQY